MLVFTKKYSTISEYFFINLDKYLKGFGNIFDALKLFPEEKEKIFIFFISKINTFTRDKDASIKIARITFPQHSDLFKGNTRAEVQTAVRAYLVDLQKNRLIISKNARLFGEASRDTREKDFSPFSLFPKEVGIRIAAHTGNSALMSLKDSIKIAEKHYDKPLGIL